MPTLTAASLEDFATRLLTAGGMTAIEALVTANSLVGANMRGYDSHGVMRIPYYVQSLSDGEIVSQATLQLTDEGPAREPTFHPVDPRQGESGGQLFFGAVSSLLLCFC